MTIIASRFSLAMDIREKHRLRVFDVKVLRIVFVPKRDEVNGSWEKLHNELFHYLYSSPN
jgi:hypothetical protein